MALLGRTRLVFVDEPTTGVDPAAKRQVSRYNLAGHNCGNFAIAIIIRALREKRQRGIDDPVGAVGAVFRRKCSEVPSANPSQVNLEK